MRPEAPHTHIRMYGEDETARPIRIRTYFFFFFIVFDILLCGWALDEAELGIVSAFFFFVGSLR